MRSQCCDIDVGGCTWAARYNTWAVVKLMPKGIVFSFLGGRHFRSFDACWGERPAQHVPRHSCGGAAVPDPHPLPGHAGLSDHLHECHLLRLHEAQPCLQGRLHTTFLHPVPHPVPHPSPVQTFSLPCLTSCCFTPWGCVLSVGQTLPFSSGVVSRCVCRAKSPF